MRYADGHKEAVRAGILVEAARALRRDGLSGVSIPALMKAAGLTHGGFYAHFASRDELVAEAVMVAAHETGASVLSKDVGDLDATLARYLSMEHVEHPEHGCVLASLGTEGRHQRGKVRRAFGEAARGFLRLLEEKMHDGEGKTRKARDSRESAADRLHDDTMLRAAQMIGAVVLARLVDDPKLASRILAVARDTTH